MADEKSRLMAFLLWLPPMGLFGLHRYYLGQWGWGLLYTFTAGNCGMSWAFDLFRIYPLVSAYNLGELHHKKYSADIFILWFSPAGIFGAHRYYVGQWGFGLFYTFTAGNYAMSWLTDFCRIWSLVDEYNDEKIGKRFSVHDSFILWLPPFGVLGAHRFYLRSYGFGTFYALTGGGFLIPYLCDLARIANMCAKLNSDLDWIDGNLESGMAKPISVRPDRDRGDLVLAWLPPFGLLGAHRYYLRSYFLAVAYTMTAGFFGIGWLIDGLLLPKLYDQYVESNQERFFKNVTVTETSTTQSAPYQPPPQGFAQYWPEATYSNPFTILFDQTTGQQYLAQPINNAPPPTYGVTQTMDPNGYGSPNYATGPQYNQSYGGYTQSYDGYTQTGYPQQAPGSQTFPIGSTGYQST